MFLEVVARIADAEVEPHAAMIDRSGELPDQLVSLLDEQDLAVVAAPEALGGAGARTVLAVLTVERLAEASAAVGWRVGVRQAALAAISASGRHGTLASPPPALIDGAAYAWVDKNGLIAGEIPRAVGIDEDTMLVILAKADSGREVALLCGAGTGSIGPRSKRCGLRGVTTAALALDGVVSDAILGEAAARAARRHRDLILGACSVGVARRAVTLSGAYLRERRQFGRPLSHFGALRRMLSDCAARVAAASSLLHAAAVRPAGSPESALQAARVSSEAAVAVADDAIQVHGGYGYVQEYVPERLLRDAITLRALAGAHAHAASAEALVGGGQLD